MLFSLIFTPFSLAPDRPAMSVMIQIGAIAWPLDLLNSVETKESFKTDWARFGSKWFSTVNDQATSRWILGLHVGDFSSSCNSCLIFGQRISQLDGRKSTMAMLIRSDTTSCLRTLDQFWLTHSHRASRAPRQFWKMKTSEKRQGFYCWLPSCRYFKWPRLVRMEPTSGDLTSGVNWDTRSLQIRSISAWSWKERRFRAKRMSEAILIGKASWLLFMW